MKGTAMTAETIWDLLKSRPPTRLEVLVSHVYNMPYPATWREQQQVQQFMASTLKESDRA